MYYKSCVFLIILAFLVEGIRAQVESCYYCSGTRQCLDPMDYNEVSARDCPYDNNCCVKYISTTRNRFGQIIGNELTYRKCSPRYSEDQDICGELRETEIHDLAEFNYTLAAFECYVCNETNCNSTSVCKWTYLWLISLLLTIFYTFT